MESLACLFNPINSECIFFFLSHKKILGYLQLKRLIRKIGAINHKLLLIELKSQIILEIGRKQEIKRELLLQKLSELILPKSLPPLDFFLVVRFSSIVEFGTVALLDDHQVLGVVAQENTVFTFVVAHVGVVTFFLKH